MNEDVISYNQLDPAIEARIDKLLAEMTLPEKIGQLVQVGLGGVPDLDAAIRSGEVGSLLSIFDVQQVNHFQRIAVEESRLHIPLIIGNDVIHGYRTIFPIPLAESCTWDPGLLERAAQIAAEEASANGTDWIFAPMVDVARDPRWGRIAEGSGEDVFLGSALAQARVRGFQAANLASGRRAVACPKHYVAYGAAEAGRDYNTVDVSERTLRELYLPPFKAAFDAGAGSVMSAFNTINGVPASANPFTLRTILRNEWQWPGVVLSDYEAIRELMPHGVAGDLKEAARLGILGGVDMDMMSHAYSGHLAVLLDEGVVPAEVIETAVRRVLRLKLQLGLFDHPYADEKQGAEIILREDFRAVALEVAQKSMVLLKNEGGLLPLAPDVHRLAVIGPLADDHAAMLGTWAAIGRPEDTETVLDGIRAHWHGDGLLAFAPGCPVQGDGPADLEAAITIAQAADIVIAVLGESGDMSGEAHSRAHLGLPGRQQELLDALHATGKPIVGVLMSGRPLVIPHLVDQVGAFLQAWHGGIRAGRAVADILFGAANPSGKLTATWPRTEGQIPIHYDHLPTGRPPEAGGTKQFEEPYKSTYMDEPNTPLFAFGYGLSYTTFAYRDLVVETPVLGTEDTLVLRATIENTGARPGEEVVQLYVYDPIASVSRPVKELKGFRRIALQPGEAQSVRFEIPVCDLGFIGPDMQYAVEPGVFQVWIGPDSAQGLAGKFTVA